MKKSQFFLTIILLAAATCLTAGCSKSQDSDAPFELHVIPEQLNGHSIAGQHCVFLVTITDAEQASENPVEISAEAQTADIIIYKKALLADQVSEVVVIPSQSAVGKSVKVSVTGTRGSLTEIKSVVFDVVEGEDDRLAHAKELQGKFIPWLESEQPELRIKGDTEWAGTMVSPQWLVVSHYLFFSKEWEMHIQWHNMIPPYDWVRIDLRHRFDELNPSYAFEISSIQAGSEPIAIEVPETVWR